MSSNKKKSISPFDFINNINKKNGVSAVFNEETGSEYNLFLTNRFFSFFTDTLFYSNEMNKYSDICGSRTEDSSSSPNGNKKAQFLFYYHLLPKKNRFTKWQKKQEQFANEEEEIELIMSYYSQSGQCSRKEAKRILSMMRQFDDNKKNEIITTMKSGVYKGGK